MEVVALAVLSDKSWRFTLLCIYVVEIPWIYIMMFIGELLVGLFYPHSPCLADLEIWSFTQVDMTALKQMGENDLKELGIPMVLYPFFCICIVYCQNFLF